MSKLKLSWSIILIKTGKLEQLALTILRNQKDFRKDLKINPIKCAFINVRVVLCNYLKHKQQCMDSIDMG